MCKELLCDVTGRRGEEVCEAGFAGADAAVDVEAADWWWWRRFSFELACL